MTYTTFSADYDRDNYTGGLTIIRPKIITSGIPRSNFLPKYCYEIVKEIHDIPITYFQSSRTPAGFYHLDTYSKEVHMRLRLLGYDLDEQVLVSVTTDDLEGIYDAIPKVRRYHYDLDYHWIANLTSGQHMYENHVFLLEQAMDFFMPAIERVGYHDPLYETYVRAAVQNIRLIGAEFGLQNRPPVFAPNNLFTTDES